MVAKPCPYEKCVGHVCTCTPNEKRKAEIKLNAGRELDDRETRALGSN